MGNEKKSHIIIPQIISICNQIFNQHPTGITFEKMYHFPKRILHL